MSEEGKSVAIDWLNSSGEIGKLIRLMGWSNTPLGPIEKWPQSLALLNRSMIFVLKPFAALTLALSRG